MNPQRPNRLINRQPLWPSRIGALLCLLGCGNGKAEPMSPETTPESEVVAAPDVSTVRRSHPAFLERQVERDVMVTRQLQGRDIDSKTVLAAMQRVPRHVLIPEQFRQQAYGDRPLPIGEGQTISQPYIVAAMTQALQLKPGQRVLEIGTGSGYQAAVLAELGTRCVTFFAVLTFW